MVSKLEVERQIEKIAELISRGLNYNEIKKFFGDKANYGMPDRTFDYRWARFQKNALGRVKKKQNLIVSGFIERGLRRSDISQKKAEITGDYSWMKTASRVDRDNLVNFARLGVIDTVADKSEVNVSGVAPLVVNFPEGFKMPRKNDIK